MKRRFWLIYLHPDEEHNPKWWEDYGFENRLKAFEYYLLKKKIIGLDAGWALKDGKIVEWINNRINFYKRFCLEMKEGDIVVFCKKIEEGYFEAILLVKDNYIFHHEKPILHKSIQYKNESWNISGYKRKDITKELWKKYNVLGNEDMDFLDYPYDKKTWFDIIRNVEVIWYSKREQECKICYSNRQTLSLIHSLDVQKKILKFIEEFEMKNLVKLLTHQKQIILYGPPGTGKTYRAKEIAARMLGVEPRSKEFQDKRFNPENNPDGAWEIVQFHSSYNYEDFVRGIMVTTEKDQVKYEVKDRIFVQMCREAGKNKDKPFILIIDEINRANLAAVLGELIYALEYRGEKVRLPYGDDPLEIPPNLYIIGTMNTADRSIGHIDYAVRRRFAFVQVLSDEEIVKRYYEDEELKKVALRLFGTIEKLFNEKDGCLSPDYHKEDIQPGHSYFLAKSIDELAFKFAYQVWPLLKEYCKDGVLLCESENCKIELNGQSFSLKENVTPEKIFEAVHGLMKEASEESKSEEAESGQEKESEAS